MKKLISNTLALVLLVGCATFYDAVVVVTEAGESIRDEYALLYKKGLVTEEQHEEALVADRKYRQAVSALADSLEVAKITGEQATVSQKLRIVKEAIQPMLEIVFALATPEKAAKLSRNLENAVASK